MSERLPNENVTRANIAISKTSEAVVCGVEMTRSGETEPYKVMSLYLPQFDSGRQALFYVCAKIIRHADKNCELIIYQGAIPQFDEWRRFSIRLGPIAEVYGIRLNFRYDKRVMFRFPNVIHLANHALERKDSIVCEV